MKTFALLENDIVNNVVNVNDEDAPTEADGIAFLAEIGVTDQAVETYDDGTRGKYAAIGDIWTGTEFISPGGTA